MSTPKPYSVPRKSYTLEEGKSDVAAGLIVAVMLIPQGLAYSLLSGLPPIIGLYTATIPLLIYALVGSSRHLAVGPVAMVSLILFAGVSQLAEPGSEQFLSLAITLTLMVGLIQLLMSVFRLGFLVNFIPYGVISGFTSAAAIMIGLSQVSHLLNISVDKSGSVFHLLVDVSRHLGEANIITLLLGIGSILLLILLKSTVPRVPGALIAVIISTCVVYVFQLNVLGVSIIGYVPHGLPSVSLPNIAFQDVMNLLPLAVTISLISFVESIAIAKYVAQKERYEIKSNQELYSLGLANTIGSMFMTMPVAGGFSRTAVNYQAGAKTKFAAVITSVFILLTLLYLTHLFYYMPKAVLAAVIIVAVYGLIDFNKAKELFMTKPDEGWALLITFFATLIIGIKEGLLIGIGFSLLIFLFKIKWLYVKK
ncbi:SulP family inorganic anion transporter [Bacillus sp. FJAT-45350]|uniref:SulP family inorganic anion transporter n=1 Tax=Bacillus sp. FJAT-45350 TaxID=2011014 RepID=UPI000BB84749|nr:SulP family inorganic anion transporter [Bacillus sp. FJAT-45350]